MDLLNQVNYKCWTIYNEEFVKQIQKLEKAKVNQSNIKSKLSTDKQIEFDKVCFGLNKNHQYLINQLKTLRNKHS